MSLLASDDFNRADANTLGANWTAAKGTSGQCGILSNQVDNGAVGAGNLAGSYYSAVSFPNDQYSQATFVALASAIEGVMARAITTGTQKNAYVAGQDANDFGGATTYRLYKWVANAATSLGTGTGTLTVNDVIYVEAVGTTIRMLANGVQKVSVTDASLASGAPGLVLQHNVDNVAMFDDWSGGDFAAAGVTYPQLERGFERGVERGVATGVI